MADEKGSGMGKVAQSAGKGENVARGMAESSSAPAGKGENRGSGTAKPAGSTSASTSATSGMMNPMKGMEDAARTMSQAASSFGMPGMGDFGKMFEGMRMPGMPDMDAVLSAYRRNLEALSNANRVALEGAQQVAKRHMEIMQQTMAEMTDAMRALASTDSPQDRAGKQAEMLKGAYERAVGNMRELADLIQRSNGEALNVLNERFAEAIDEARGMVEKSRS